MPTNYVYLKKNGNVVYPKTKLSAIDMTLCNGLQISGETMSLSAATALQVKQGAIGRVVMADGLKEAIATYSDALYIPGDGFAVNGGTIGLVSANTYEVLTVAEGTERLPVDNKNLNGAMNLGRAVDVSSAVNHNTFTSATSQDGVTTLAVSSAASSTYYYGWNTQYPKFAAGLKYLIMVDYMCPGDQVTAYLCSHATSDRGIISGIPYSTSAISSSQYTRLASVFATSNNVGFFVSRGSASNIQIKLKNFKVFEVTALNDEAIAALASAENPDAIYEKFLIKQDAVCPWILIIDMANSPALTVGAGLAYNLLADDGGTHELYVDTFPENAYGREAYLTLFVGETSSIHVNSPLVLMDPLTPNAVNNCVIRFRDGYARMYVLDTDYGYAVTVTTGDVDGTLRYGLINTAENYITFSHTTDELDCVCITGGTTIPATTSTVRTILGNGKGVTSLNFDGGVLKPDKHLLFTNTGVKNATITGGSISLRNVVIGDNTVVSSGTLRVLGENELSGMMTFAGGTMTLNGTKVEGSDDATINISSSVTAPISATGSSLISDVTLTGTTTGYTPLYVSSGATLTLRDCVISGILQGESLRTGGGTNGGAIRVDGAIILQGSTISDIVTPAATYTTASGTTAYRDTLGTVYANGVSKYIEAIDCVFSGNSIRYGGAVMIYYGTAVIYNCTISGNTAANYGGGLYATTSATINVSSSTISGNTAYNGGGLCTYNSATINVSSSTISGNVGRYQICRGEGAATIRLEDCVITGNTSQDVGAVAYNTGEATVAYITNCYISGNLGTLASNGGTLYNSINAKMYITGTTITGNTCTYGHGTVAGINGATQVYSNCVLDGDFTIREANSSYIEFGGSNYFTGTMDHYSIPKAVTISAGATIDLSGNSNTNAIRGSTITALGTITIIARDGTEHQYSARSVTGSTITNTGLWLS